MKNRSEIDQEYLKDQETRMASYVVGANNPSGQKIVNIYSKGDEYLIYDIDAFTPIESFRVLIDTREETDQEPDKRYNEVKDEFDIFKSVMYKTGADSSYKHRAAHAIAVAIAGDIDKARELFIKIQEDMTNEFRERLYGRLSYFGGAVIFVAVLTILSTLTYLMRDHEIVSSNIILLQYLIGTTFAGYGGLLSVSIKIKELFIEKALNNWMYAVYGAERLIFSILGGIAVLTLLKANLIFSSLMNEKSAIFVVLSLCFISGFSETLIPNTLRKIEGQNNGGPSN